METVNRIIDNQMINIASATSTKTNLLVGAECNVGYCQRWISKGVHDFMPHHSLIIHLAHTTSKMFLGVMSLD